MLRITTEYFDKLFVFVNDDITKQITNMRRASTPKIFATTKFAATKIFHVDSIVIVF